LKAQAGMKKSLHPQLKHAINHQALFLAAQAAPAIRARLEERARALIREGAPQRKHFASSGVFACATTQAAHKCRH
jgi:hypothetical protein